MAITDAQIHIWGADSPDRPWPATHGHPQRPEPLRADEVIAEMDAAGVDRAVIVPPSWEGNRNDLALKASEDYPGRFAVMGRLDIKDSGSADLAHWRDVPAIKGVRLTLGQPNRPSALEEGTAEWFWPQAEKYGLPVMVFAPGHTAGFASVAERYPDLRLIIDHLNIASRSIITEVPDAVEPLYDLARFPNVAVKISALPAFATEPYPFVSLRPHIRRVIGAFGAERCLWGSDLSRLPCPYIDWLRAITEDADYLSGEEKALIMGGAAARWLDWPETS